MTHLSTNHYENRSVLASLRTVIPTRNHITFPEALRIAELHANRLLELHHISDGPTPNEIITELPKLQIEFVEAPVSGASFWNGHVWIIQLNRAESFTRQRFTLAHEYKHIIDHGAAARLYTGSGNVYAADQAEQAADYFAGCLLVPRRLLKRAWGNGLQRPRELPATSRCPNRPLPSAWRRPAWSSARRVAASPASPRLPCRLSATTGPPLPSKECCHEACCAT